MRSCGEVASSFPGQITSRAEVNQIDTEHAATARLPDLVRAAQGGNSMAMAELLDVLAPYVARLCGPIALDDGADAAQEALITIFTSIRQLREPAALFGWARVIAIREAIRVARKARRAAPAELADVPTPGDPQLASDVRDVLRRLAPHHRAILVLRDLEGLDEQTVSDMLAVSTGTAKSRLHRARRRFRQEWDR
jgi:RNA polymerase sigma-70 factor (ECF subfamily)